VKLIIFALIPLILVMGIVPTIFLNAHADYIDKFSLPYVLEPLSESQIKNCESIHTDFISLSDFDFYTRYQTNNIAGNCVMLYEDSLWDYDESDRYEKLSERSTELIQEHEVKLKQSRENFYIESKSLTELQIPGTFLFKFEGCTGDQTINARDISVISDKETFLLTKFVGEERVIPPGVCNKLEIQIRADDPSSIKVIIPSLEVEVSAKLDKETTVSTPIDVIIPNKAVIARGDLSHKSTPLDEKNMNECKNINSDFQKFNENDFNTRYLYHQFVGDCVILFEDSIWEDRDSSSIEQINQRLDELKKQKEISIKGDEFKPFSITALSLDEISDGLYLYSFEGCTGDEFVNVGNAVAASDVEVLSLVIEKREANVLPPSICKVLDIKIHAEDPNSIRIVLPMMGDEYMSPNSNEDTKNQKRTTDHFPYQGICAPGFTALDEICVLNDRCGVGIYPGKVCIIDGKEQPYLKPLKQKFAGISADNIICAEEKQLMFKLHDAFPVCVNSDSVEKLKQRGFQDTMPPLMCTLEWNPMCGMDGNTYGNPCNLHSAHMTLNHQGECEVN
jgi:hypothetical protein